MKSSPHPSESSAKAPKSFAQNATWNAVSAFVTIASNLATTPYYVGVLGLEKYGIVALLATVTGPLAILNAGVNQAATRYVALHGLDCNKEHVHSYLGATLITNIAVGIIGAGVFLLAPWILLPLFRLPESLKQDASAALLSCSAVWFLSQISNTARGVLEGLRNQSILSVGDVVTNFLTASLCSLACWHYASVQAFVLAQALALIATMPYWLHQLHSRAGGLRLPWGASLSRVPEVWSYSRWQVGAGVISLLANFGDRYFIGIAISTASLGLYNVALRAQSLARMAIAILNRALFPALSAVSDRSGEAEALFLATNASTTLGLGGLLGLATFSLPVFGKIWLGAETGESIALPIQLLTFHLLFELPSSMLDVYFTGKGVPWWSTGSSLLLFVLTAVAMIPAGFLWGMEGVIFGAMAAYAFGKLILKMIAFRRIFSNHFSESKYYGALYGPVLAAMASSLVSQWILAIHESRVPAIRAMSIPECLIAAVLYLIVYGGIVWVTPLRSLLPTPFNANPTSPREGNCKT